MTASPNSGMPGLVTSGIMIGTAKAAASYNRGHTVIRRA